MDTGIELKHVSKTYRIPSVLPWKPRSAAVALKDVSFSCPASGISCVLGPNGSGKTTIIKILSGLVTPDGGETVLGAGGRRARARIGLATSNERSFYWRLTGRQNLEFFAALYGAAGKSLRDAVDAVLNMVGLAEEADKPVRQYSSGMKQRLLLSRALLGNPEILLLDEPTAHLDHPGRKAVHGIIKDALIRDRGLTVVVCTNDLAEARDLADNLVLLNKGVVLANGPLAELQSMLETDWRLRIGFERFPREGWMSALSAAAARREGDAMVCRVPDPSAVPDIVESAVQAGGRITDCLCSQPSLEDVFERLIPARA